jgi:hypothetical protein
MGSFFAIGTTACAPLAEILATIRVVRPSRYRWTGSFVLPSSPARLRGALASVSSWGRILGPVERKVGDG